MTDATMPDPGTQPETDAQEIAPTRNRKYLGTHIFLLSCIAMVAAFLTWATVGRLDVVSTATGEVVPASQVKSIQHLEGGIVREIKVQEGERVRQGQPLIVLEPTRSGAEVEELNIRLASLRVEIARLEAEEAGAKEPDFPADLLENEPDLVRQARAMFNTRRDRVGNQLRGQREQIVQRQQEIREVETRMRGNRTNLKLVTEQLAISKKLMKLDLSNRMNHLNLLKEAATLKGQLDEDTATLPRVRAALGAAQAQLAAIKSGFREEAQKELDAARRTLKELTQRLRKFEDSLRRTVLRAPVDGTVKTLYVVTRGGVIQAGQTVLDIVPGDDRLVIEAQLPTGDIGFVEIGQEAQIQLASAEAVRFGTLDGKVIHISPDTLVTKQGVPFYKVRIQTERDYFERGDHRYRLSPGMQVVSSIRTGTRTVMHYLLDPYIGSMGQALRER